MTLQSFYPIIVTPHVTTCRDFYRTWFGFSVIFEASWFVLLGASAGTSANIAFMHPDHPSAPPGPETFTGTGMCLEFQVEDAALEYERFTGGGAPLTLSLPRSHSDNVASASSIRPESGSTSLNRSSPPQAGGTNT
jgi:hypothetical protein